MTATKPESLTVKQTLLKAAATFREGERFTLGALAVRAWQLDPRACGVRGLEAESADTHLAAGYVMGRRGLAGAGLLEKVAPMTYRLTDKGRRAAAGATERKEMREKKISPRATDAVTAALTHPAFVRYWAPATRPMITADQAAGFVDIPYLDRALAEVAAAAEDDTIRGWGGQEWDTRRVRKLAECRDWLRKAFARHLERRVA